MKKNILAIQMHSTIGDIRANYEKANSLIENFYSNSTGELPDLIVLPEVWTTGWYCDIFSEFSEETNETENFLSKIAKKHNVNIIGGSYIKNTGGLTKNTCPVINRDGEVIARYEKIHLYSPDGEAKAVCEGDVPVIVNIDGVKIGLSICYDIRFPELFRSYINSQFPPEMMINMSAWPLSRKEQYESLAKARAIENQCYFLALSQTGHIKGDSNNSGNSLLVEPMGNIIQKLGEEEGYIFASLDTSIVDEVRKTYPNLINRKVHNFGFVPEFFGGSVSCLRK